MSGSSYYGTGGLDERRVDLVPHAPRARDGVQVQQQRKSRFTVPRQPYKNPKAVSVEADASSATYALAMAAVKKYFSSNMPRGVAMNLFEVTRLTVLSCISMASAISRRTKGLR